MKSQASLENMLIGPFCRNKKSAGGKTMRSQASLENMLILSLVLTAAAVVLLLINQFANNMRGMGSIITSVRKRAEAMLAK